MTVKDVFPLPLTDDCLDTLSGSIWFSKLDANSKYWQVQIKEEDRKKTAFITKYGLFEHIRKGFGLCGAPATYARAMNLVLRGLTWKTVLAFLDELVVLGKSFEDHVTNLKEALERFRKHGLKLKPKKCTFFQQEIEFSGRKVSSDSLAITESDIEVVRNWPVPTFSKHVEIFMGLVNSHRGFIKDFSKIATPLYAVTGKHQFVWNKEQSEAFETLKKALVHPPVLALPNEKDYWILDTDSSDFAIGGELIQVQEGKEKVIAYASFALTKEQRRYCVTRKELLAVVRFTRQFRHYLLGRLFVVRTDHSSLRWLMRFREPQGQLAKWLEELSQYNMVLQHRVGRMHQNADTLSRLPVNKGQCIAFDAGVRLEDLPCGGCKYCRKAQQSWGSFLEDVDDAVPLVTKTVQPVLSGAGHSTGTGNAIGIHKGIGTVVHGCPIEILIDQIIESDKQVLAEHQCGYSLSEAELYVSDPNKNCTTQCDSSFQQDIHKQPYWNPGEMISREDVAILEKTVQQVPWEVKCCIINQNAVNISVVTTRQQKKDEVISETHQSSRSRRKDAQTDSSTSPSRKSPAHKPSGCDTASQTPSASLSETRQSSRSRRKDAQTDSSTSPSRKSPAHKPSGCDTAGQTPSASLSETRQSSRSRRKYAQTDNSTLPSRKTPAHKPSGCDTADQIPSASEHNSSKTDTLCSWGFSLKDLKEAQRKDEDFTIILDWVQRSIEPDSPILFRPSPAVKYYSLNKEMFLLIDGILYQNDVHTGDKRLVLPKSLRELAIQLNHNLPSAGHQGAKRTKERLKEKYVWYGLGKDVSAFFSSCEVCNQNKMADRQGQCRMTEYQAGSPMERVHLDFLGPLPKTPRGNEYVLVMVDQFTKWVECIPLPNHSAIETARAAVNNFFSRFGMPFQVFSDQGRNFESKLFTEICKILEIHKARTTPYRPSSNGQCERYNRTLMDAIWCFIGKS